MSTTIHTVSPSTAPGPDLSVNHDHGIRTNVMLSREVLDWMDAESERILRESGAHQGQGTASAEKAPRLLLQLPLLRREIEIHERALSGASAAAVPKRR